MFYTWSTSFWYPYGAVTSLSAQQITYDINLSDLSTCLRRRIFGVPSARKKPLAPFASSFESSDDSDLASCSVLRASPRPVSCSSRASVQTHTTFETEVKPHEAASKRPETIVGDSCQLSVRLLARPEKRQRTRRRRRPAHENGFSNSTTAVS